MASRVGSWLSAIAFAGLGVAAAGLWVAIRGGVEPAGVAYPDFGAAAVTAESAGRRDAPQPPAAAPSRVSTSDSRGETSANGAASVPTATDSWDARFRDASDYFAFAQAAARAAMTGDARAQYLLGQALQECAEQVRPVASMQRGSAADNLNAYLALIPSPATRDQVVRRVARCERFFEASPLDDLDVAEDAHSPGYWFERARESRDALAVMDRAIDESLHQHADSLPDEHRAELLDDVRVAVASRDPAALYKIGTVYSRDTIAKDDAQGAAWIVAACAAGYDCSNANAAIGQGCVERGACDEALTVAQHLERDLGPARFAEVSAAGQDILAKVERGDWQGLAPYLATK